MRAPNTAVAAAWLNRVEARRSEILPQWFFIHALTDQAAGAARAWMAWAGWTRRAGSKTDLAGELAGTVVCAYAVAAKTGIDLDAAIAARHEALTPKEKTS